MLRNTFLLIPLLIITLLLYGCGSDGPRIMPVDQNAVVLAFGDSLTRGTGAPAGQSYPDVLSALLNNRVINEGVPGEVSATGLKRLPGVLDRYNPSLVILCHGGNDFLRRHDQEQTISNLKAMIELIRSRGADVILVAVPRLGFGLEVPDFFISIAEEYAVPVEEEILIDLLGDNDFKSDTIHPNASGYRMMAEAIYQTIEEAEQI